MAITPDLINSILVRDADSAAEVLTRLLVSDECGLADLAQLGAYLVPRGRYDLAEKVFARWTASVPNNPEPWTNLGLCLSRQKKMIEWSSMNACLSKIQLAKKEWHDFVIYPRTCLQHLFLCLIYTA